MPRYEYIGHEGSAHVITAPNLRLATTLAWLREHTSTGSMTLADRASGTVEQSDERSRAA